MNRSYRIGAFEVLPAERQVLREGRPVPLGARAFDLLLALVARPGQSVSKEELLQQVWPGVVVEENNLTVQVSALRKLLGPEVLKTIPGRGYQLAAAVETPSATGAAPASPRSLPLPDKPSVVVLPFEDLSPARDQQFFVEGMAEEITTELSRFRSLFVIARASAFSYRGKEIDLRSVSAELGVRYILLGSVRRQDAHLRVCAQLVEGATGIQLWAERYDRDVSDLFVIQQEVTQAIVASIAPEVELSYTERASSAPVRSLTAHELGMTAWLRSEDALTHVELAAGDEPVAIAREALAIDPNCGPALRAIARAGFYHLYFGRAASPARVWQDAMDAAARAVAVDRRDAVSYLLKGILHYVAGDSASGLLDMRRARELNANDVLVLSALGFFEALSGNASLGIDLLDRALRLNPSDPRRSLSLNMKAWAHFAAADYAKGLDFAEQALAEASGLASSQLCRTICLAGLARLTEARDQYARLFALAPSLVSSRLAGQWLSEQPDYVSRGTALLRLAAGGDPAQPLT